MSLTDNVVKVSVSKILDEDASTPFPISEVQFVRQAKNTFITLYPKKPFIEHVDKSKPINDPLVDLVKVVWDATLFGVDNDDFPLFIDYNDAKQIISVNQCLSITIL
ncbi:hypothetical protein GmHk_09G025397 [Glycine max]|nr:hypothetical protein GmHk_09G025397 [Glycine max]